MLSQRDGADDDGEHPGISASSLLTYLGASAGNFGKSTSIDPVTQTIGADVKPWRYFQEHLSAGIQPGHDRRRRIGTGDAYAGIFRALSRCSHSTQANFGQTVTSEWA